MTVGGEDGQQQQPISGQPGMQTRPINGRLSKSVPNQEREGAGPVTGAGEGGQAPLV